MEPLASIGYVFFPNATPADDRKYFKRLDLGIEVAHLHVTEYGSLLWERQILFRDCLRAHPAESSDYRRMKRELAELFPARGPFGPFSAAKTDFIIALLARARADSGQDINAVH